MSENAYDSVGGSNMPLPAPTTVTSRSVRPRRGRGRSVGSNRSATTSRSSSRSVSVLQTSEYRPSIPDAIPRVTTNAMGDDAQEGLAKIEPELEKAESDAGEEEETRKRRRDQDELLNEEGTVAQSSRIRLMELDEASPRKKMRSAASYAMECEIIEGEGQSISEEGQAGAGIETIAASTSQQGSASEYVRDGFLLQRGMIPFGPSDASEVFGVAGPSSTPRLLEATIDVDALPDNFPASSGPAPATNLSHTASPIVIGNRTTELGHSVSPSPSTRFLPSVALPPPSQSEPEPLSAFTCPICFGAPTYATLTPCGHVCCGDCLFTAVKTTMQRSAMSLPVVQGTQARCPVCRATIPGWDGRGGGVIGLQPRVVITL